MTSKEMMQAKLKKGMIFENQSKLGSKPNWKVVPANVDKYPSFAAFCDECGCPFRDGKQGCDCSA